MNLTIIMDVANRHDILKQNFSETEPVAVISRAGFKGERTWRSFRILDKAGIESSDFIATFASLKWREVTFHFQL
jgi:hypothetical protein